MSNYGYECKRWSKENKNELATQLKKLLNDMKLTLVEGGASCDYPYIEVDGLYEGVRIRKTTYLSEKDMGELIDRADKIFLDIEEKVFSP